MQYVKAFVLILAVVVLSIGCERSRRDTSPLEAAKSAAESMTAMPPDSAKQNAESYRGGGGGGGSGERLVSMTSGTEIHQSSLSPDRKIIRNAELTLEIEAPSDGQSKITAIAESFGGYVVTSEFRQNDPRNQSRPKETVTVVVRVPSSKFGEALDSIRAVGTRIVQEKVSGQDVTQEYIDLEARIRSQRALEAQFLEIMKQAKKVSDALEVQRQLADVRTEIEQLEGRRRFLENQSALSTITISLQTPAPIVTATTSGFGADLKDAFGDGVDTAVSIVLGLIRLIIILIPVGVLIILPIALLGRVILRRFRLIKKPEPVAESQ